MISSLHAEYLIYIYSWVIAVPTDAQKVNGARPSDTTLTRREGMLTS